MRVIRRFLAAALATMSWAAVAGQHHICYEADMQQSLPTGVWACRDDAGGSCTIVPLFASNPPPNAVLPGNLPGTYEVRQLPGAASFDARIDFIDAAGVQSSRTCTINAVSPYGMRGAASAGAELTGFTTDASGLVTTGVWKLLSASNLGANTVTLEVPADFVAVGGGAVGKASPYGALVFQSRQSDLMGGAPCMASAIGGAGPRARLI